MENIFSENIAILYFIAILYIMLFEKLKINQKMIIVYIFSYLIIYYGLIDFKIMLLLFLVGTFIYFEYLTNDEVKNEMVTNFFYKIQDYLYKMIFENSMFTFFLSLIIQTNYINLILNKIFNLNVEIIKIANFKLSVGILLSLLLLLIAITRLNIKAYWTNSLSTIKNKMCRISYWAGLNISKKTKEKFFMLSDIEDKSFFFRKNSYNILSTEFLKYKLKKITQENKSILYTEVKIHHFKKLLKNLIKIPKFIKNQIINIRGYSTIEMQLIRTLGIQNGFSKIIRRKIYEVIYSNIYFKSYRRYCNKNKYDTNCTYKEYIMFCYIHLAPIKINNRNYPNMLALWNTNNITKITKEQFFISILGLSWRPIDENIIYNYKNIIDKYNLNTAKIISLINSITKC